MRWRLGLCFGVAGAVAGSALGQFAADRVPQSPPTMPGTPSGGPQQPTTPPAPGAYTPPVGGVIPAGYNGAAGGGLSSGYPTLASANSVQTTRIGTPPSMEIASALGPNHPWALKPEHGPYFICAKSYSRPHTPTPEDNGPSARTLAEALAGQIREIHHVQAFLYEYVSEERKAEAAAMAAERERGRIFAEQIAARQQQTELQGMEWMPPDNKIRFKTVNYRDQIAVLIGGFQSDEEARKALDLVRTWPSPKDKILMDGVVVAKLTGDGKGNYENGYLNPYKSATVVPNPLIPRQTQPVSTGVDPFIVKLNDGRRYNLLKATKEWTLAVKSFDAPVEIVSKETDPNRLRKTNSTKGANALLAGEVQADELAKMLREMKGPGGQALGLESFVLLTRHSSIVTVGQFDGPNDPALIQTQNLLTSMKLNVSQDKMGTRPVGNAPTLLDDRLIPIRVPHP
jgi:hypothetical protein